MNFKKTICRILTLFITMLLSASAALAQPGGGGDPLPCDPEDTTSPQCQVPLDTWVYVPGDSGRAFLARTNFIKKIRPCLFR